MTVREQEISVERGTGTPNLYRLTGGVSFLLKDFAERRVGLRRQRHLRRLLHALLAKLLQSPRAGATPRIGWPSPSPG